MTIELPAAIDAGPLLADRALSNALDSLLTDDVDREGRHILTYALDAKLRSLLQIRLYRLQAELIPGRPADLARAVTEMMLGFGSARASEEDAEAVVTEYVKALAHLPVWAVERACLRFARGRVNKKPGLETRLRAFYGPALPCHRGISGRILPRRASDHCRAQWRSYTSAHRRRARTGHLWV